MSTVKADRNVSVPATWDVRPLGKVVRPTRPRIKPSEKPDLPFIGMENIEAHTMKLLGTVPAGTMKSSAVHFLPDDVLYGRLRPYLNKVYRPDFEGLCSAEFIVFPKTESISSRYLQYFLNSSSFASYPKTEIGIGWEAEKDLVGRAGRGYNGCIAKHNL